MEPVAADPGLEAIVGEAEGEIGVEQVLLGDEASGQDDAILDRLGQPSLEVEPLAGDREAVGRLTEVPIVLSR